MKSFKKLILFCFLALTFNVTHASDKPCSQKPELENRSVELDSPLVEQIVTNDQGVFLLVNDFWVCSQALQASEEGLFVLVNGEWKSLLAAIESGDCIQASWKCSKCGRYSMDGINVCPYCGKRKNG